MVVGIVFMLVAVTWFVFRRQVAVYQVRLVAAKFKALPVRNRDEKARELEDIAFPLCLMLFGVGALLTGSPLLFG